jgi:hypothetical protein
MTNFPPCVRRAQEACNRPDAPPEMKLAGEAIECLIQEHAKLARKKRLPTQDAPKTAETDRDS